MNQPDSPKLDLNESERDRLKEIVGEMRSITEKAAARQGPNALAVAKAAAGAPPMPKIPVEEFVSQMPMQPSFNPFAPKLIKPDTQAIDSDMIHWKWNLPDGCGVRLTAEFLRGNQTYRVQLVNNYEISSQTGEAAIIIGNALRSAGDWENKWRQYVGELMFPDSQEERESNWNLEDEDFEGK